MAISFVGSKTYSAAGANSGTFSVSLTDLLDTAGSSATLLQGDLLIITNVVGGTTDKGSANLLASTWTGIAPTDGTGQYANDTNDTNLQVQYKVMGASPDTTVSIPNSGSTADAVAGTIFALRGTGSSPASSAAITGIDTGRPNPPAVAPSVAGSWIVVCGGAAAAAGSAFTNPGDLSATTNHFRSVSQADTVDAMAGCGIKTNWAAGSFDPAQWTGGTTGTGDSWAAVTLVIEPTAAQTYNNSISEGITAGASEGSAATFPNARSESATAGESLASAAIFPNALSEAASLTDSATGGLAFSVSITEALSPADAYDSAVYKLYAEAVSEGLSLADAYQGTVIGTHNESLSESLELGDFLSLSISGPSAWVRRSGPPAAWAPETAGGPTWTDNSLPLATWAALSIEAISWASSGGPPATWGQASVGGLFDAAIFDAAIFDTGEIVWTEQDAPPTSWS